MKKILLLGGSQQQIPAIESAKEQGYYTILCDYLLDNPGQYISDEFHCISTTDKKKILDLAKQKNIDGVVAYASDPAAPTAAYVAENLDLPTQPYNSVKILTNKDEFRKFLKQNKFHTPKSGGYSNFEDAKRDFPDFKTPIVIKPIDSSGSKGVSKVNDIKKLEEKFEYAISFSRAKRVIIEEYVDMIGYQVAGDGFSIDGKLIFRCFANDHFNENGLNPFVPISASFPYHMPKRIHDKIHNEIQRLFNLLDMGTGAYNFDVRIDENENVYLMEIGPRNGGNYIPQVTKYATGIDMVEYTIRAAMGEDCSNIKMVNPKGFWSYYAVHSRKKGVLKNIKIKNYIEKKNIVEKFLNYKIGDKVPAFEGANASLGIFIMKFDSIEEMIHMMDHSDEWIQVIVD